MNPALVKKYNLKKFTTDKILATTILTLNSLNITLKVSFVVISPSANPLIINVDDGEPEFPPVSISIGINDANITTD